VPPLLIIADARDSLADDFGAIAAAGGRPVDRLGYPEAAQHLTVRRSGSRASVQPEAAIFLRPPLGTNRWLTRERQFHQAEIFSLVWAAAALTAAPVVNRPDAHGLGSRSRASAAVLRWRAGITPNRPEVASNDPARVEDAPRGPLERTIVSVTVAGGRGFMAGEFAVDRRMPKRAQDVCAALGVAFATVTWRLSDDQSDMELARVNQCPVLAEIGDAWPCVAAALLEELTE
jgi:hypothetical protein